MTIDIQDYAFVTHCGDGINRLGQRMLTDLVRTLPGTPVMVQFEEQVGEVESGLEVRLTVDTSRYDLALKTATVRIGQGRPPEVTGEELQLARNAILRKLEELERQAVLCGGPHPSWAAFSGYANAEGWALIWAIMDLAARWRMDVGACAGQFLRYVRTQPHSWRDCVDSFRPDGQN